ncbi:hypothetical protein M8C21_020152 [Ambrosia artemisiifolia]|uniref:Stress-related protein n=1 Tax=Ambrosia artemisiifolia TaxID=4212 RepID=A0AAD5GFT2_AMBAR|nr:hypothetical protein M8C21_020152 [Ambrosia artemisiifolia]
MAESHSQANQTTEPLAQKDGGEKHLKYLGFVQTLVIYIIVCLSAIYRYGRENAGRFKPSVQTAENTVKTVIGPIYEKFQHVPFELLKFLDIKARILFMVGEALVALNRHVPRLTKQVSSHVKYAGQNLPGVARDLAYEALKSTRKVTNALYIKYEPTAKELYKTYEPVAEKYAVSTWRSMNKLPLFPQVAQIVVPTTAFLFEKYNCTVCYTAERGYVVAQYLPLVPIEKIAKVFADGDQVSNRKKVS